MERLIEKMRPENKRINELMEFVCKGFFVNLKENEEKIGSPSELSKSIVKARLEKFEERIENGEPFLLLPFSKIQKKIAQGLLKQTFESIIPIQSEITKLILPLKTC